MTVCVPTFGILGIVAELLFHLPVFGKRPNVYTAADAASCPENVGVPHREPQAAVSAHAESGNGAPFAAGACGVMTVYVGGEFVRDKGLKLRLGLGRAVPVPAAFAIGAYENEAVAGGYLVERRLGVYPAALVAAVSVQEIDDRVCGASVVVVGENDKAGDGALHLVAADFLFYDSGWCGQRDEQEYKGESVFHVVVVGICAANLVKIADVVLSSVSVSGGSGHGAHLSLAVSVRRLLHPRPGSPADTQVRGILL